MNDSDLRQQKIPPYWEDTCPVCEGKAVTACRCMINDRTCKNGHTWHWANNQKVEGSGH